MDVILTYGMASYEEFHYVLADDFNRELYLLAYESHVDDFDDDMEFDEKIHLGKVLAIPDIFVPTVKLPNSPYYVVVI